VGHIANDNPWIALPLYAFLLGIAMRFIDQRVRNYVEDPFIVVPLGAGLAQILALPRGELGLFAFQLTASIIGGWLVLRVVGPLVWRSVEPVMLDEESDSEDPGQGNSDRQWTEGRVEAGLTSRADT
jgi:hypothetical protein